MVKKTKAKVVVGMSGGVDSSAAAALLKADGYDVIGATFRMWPKEECGRSAARACCSLDSITRARAVALQLKIPYYVFDFSKAFKEKVIDYFCAGYMKGHTPNPCIACNEAIKFGLLLEKARALGAEAVATGHYVNAAYDRKRGRYLLKEGRDKAKEQSYFLCRLSQEQLASSIFPVGRLTKERVRALAKRLKLKTHNTVSSQDICFVRDDDYAEYIAKRTGAKAERGDIVDSRGIVVGSHKGITGYTIGQRRGLGIAHKEPLYVTGIDFDHNRLAVGPKSELMKRGLIAGNMNWIAVDSLAKPVRVFAKIRYNHKKAAALATPVEGGRVKVEFDEPQAAPTPGQAVVLYQRDVVLGGGWISEAL